MLNSLSKYFTRPIEVPDRFGMDVFWYSTRGEMELVRDLMDVEEAQLDAWHLPKNGDIEVNGRGVCCKPSLDFS